MAVYRLPPQNQWHQHGPLDLSLTQSVDSPPLTQPDQPVAAYERLPYPRESWQPLRLLDVSLTQSVDSPPLTKPPEPSSDWWRPPAWTQGRQQPRDLLTVEAVQSIDSPTGAPVQEPWLRPPYWAGTYQQPRRLVDLSISQSVDSPTGMPTQDVVFARPAYPLEPWQPKRYIDTSYTQSVDSPPGNVTQPAFRRTVPFPTQRVPFDPELFTAVQIDNPPLANPAATAPYRRTPTAWQAWQAHELLDTSYTQSVDSPPFIVSQPAPYLRTRPWQPQLGADFAPLFSVDQVPTPVGQPPAAYVRNATTAALYLRRVLDVSITQSVDAPPGLAAPLEVYDRKRGQWPQTGPGVALLGGPDTPGFPSPTLYLRDAPSRVPWQRRPFILFPSVDSPSSPFVVTGASYRRPGPALLQPQTAVVTLIPPLTVVVGPGVSRTYMLAAHTTIEADGRRIYTSDGHTIYTTDGRRTYLPDARRTYRRK